jgi:hypothetical protein
MTNTILFTNTTEFVDIEKPVLSLTVVPDWYKNTESYVGGQKVPNGLGGNSGTIKKCMPVFDAITAGYMILLPADVYVSIKDGEQFFEWANFNLISFHPVQQAELHPARKNNIPYPKFNNPWSIKTPEGYSILFVHPMHQNLPFTILPGIVDTDKYFSPVNFPMVINDPLFEGMIPKGTPIAQVIPFKRESWEIKYGAEEDIKAQKQNAIMLESKFFDRYKNMFRTNKEYK